MFIAILILIIIASLLLTFVVLIQNSKGGGLAANFAAGNQTFGVDSELQGWRTCRQLRSRQPDIRRAPDS